jgi:transposase
MPDRQEQWAVFWCSLLGPLLYGEVPPEEAGRFLNQLAASEHVFPDGQRRRPSRATVWRKWKQYRDGGFEALFRKRRSDRGQPRKVTPAMIAKAVELKTEQPYRSNVALNQFLESEFGRTIPKSTLYRHLKRAGATRLKLGISQRKVRRRWTRDHSNALWLGDFEDGPYVLASDRAVPTHLSAFIDCHSRYVVEARFALNIRLIHRGVGDPPPGGLIERFFGTTQTQLESEVRAGEILTLDRLNHALAAWMEQSYHQQPHSETRQPPRQRYHQGQRFTRHVNLQEVLKYFLRGQRRKVHPDFSDVQLEGLFFQVDPRLRGDWVEVRYDPFSPLETVLLYSPDGEYLGVGKRHQRQSVPSQPPKQATPKPKHNYLELLIQKHEQTLRERHAAFSADELESLQKVYQRLSCLDAPMLREACERAAGRTIPDIVFLLQQLAHEKQRKT